MTENNESGNRWEAKPADENAEGDPAAPAVVEPVEPVAAQPPQEPTVAAPTGASPEPVTLKLPSWVSKRGLVATGAITAIFLGGGGAGYAIGSAAHDDNDRQVPAQFDRNGIGPGGQLPGGQAPDFQQGPQSQSQDDSGSSSDSSSGTAS